MHNYKNLLTDIISKQWLVDFNWASCVSYSLLRAALQEPVVFVLSVFNYLIWSDSILILSLDKCQLQLQFVYSHTSIFLEVWVNRNSIIQKFERPPVVRKRIPANSRCLEFSHGDCKFLISEISNVNKKQILYTTYVSKQSHLLGTSGTNRAMMINIIIPIHIIITIIDS